MAKKVIEIRRRCARILGHFVVATESDGFLPVRIAAKFLDLAGRHQSALELQAAHRVGRELAEVIRFGGAEIALGRDMQANRLADVRPEAFGQPRN